MKKWIFRNLLTIAALLFYLAIVAIAQHTNIALYNLLTNGGIFDYYVGVCKYFIKRILRKWQH